jgi:error-prone DNA polymerase
MNAATAYAELDVTTNFSFLRGGSHPEELVATAKELGLAAIAVTDRNTLAGVVRAHLAARELGGIKFIVGARLDLEDAPSLLAYPTDRAAYGRLCRLLTLGQRRAEKGKCTLFLEDVSAHAEGLIFIVVPSDMKEDFKRIKEALGPKVPLYLAASHSYRGGDRARIGALAQLSKRTGIPLVATNAVLYHTPERRPLQDVLTCIREKCTLREAGLKLEANAERHLKSPERMARLFAGYEEALANTIRIAEACRFSLDELKYEYPDEPVPDGKTPQSHLEDLTWAGAEWRFPDGISEKVRETLLKELALIAELNYAPYFLTVHDIVRYARFVGILCQGRGSAANSAVCYCLGITNVDPTEIELLFERFVSPERKEPPDIDVDFEHERREEVIQYIYARYGRDRAGLAATVICYRGRLAVREVGKALGLSEDSVSALATTIWGLSNSGLPNEYVRQAGLDPSDPLIARCLELTKELIGFPRHLSQHVGGFVLTRGPLSEVVPIGNAAMEDRTVIEWDKDDLDALGLLKVDVLGLGMLTCIRKAFAMLKEHYGRDFALGTVPREDSAVYDMLCNADSIGVFQVESRAQMNMLPRLRPRKFYDIVIEVAIVRPGPIQGDMVHPYLRRRAGLEAEDYPSPHPDHGPADELRQVLGKTMGVPLFQEQAMRLAMVAAKFSGPEANELRRAMATFRRRGTIDRLREKMVGRMTARGYPADFAERCFNQIKGFGEYGFPESHAASFAHLVYVSAWIKCHYPAVFAAALLNSQPMGFYAPAQIVRCARDHGVEAREVDVNHSLWDCTLEPKSVRTYALRLGLRQIDGFREADAQTLVSVRDGIPAERNPHLFAPPLPSLSSPGLTGRFSNPVIHENEDQGLLDACLRGHDKKKAGKTAYRDVRDLWRRSGLKRASLERLAAADSLRSLRLDRREALWEVRGLPKEAPLPLFDGADVAETGADAKAPLPVMPLSEHVVNDYRTLRLSLKAHPMSFLRTRFASERILACADLKKIRDRARVSVSGVVLVRQRPGSAEGVVFMTMEDETGVANAVIWPKVLERERKVVMAARLVVVHGRIQRHEDIIHVVAARLEDRSHWLRLLDEEGESLSLPIAHGDHIKHAGGEDSRERLRERGHPRWHPRKHPRSERIIPKSRDFH